MISGANNKGVFKLEELGEVTGYNKPIVIDIAAYAEPGSVSKQLHPDTPKRFKSILGDLYSLGNGMRYLNSSKFKLSWLSKELSKNEFNEIRKGGSKNVPNYWELVKLLAVDRILSDKQLILDIDKLTSKEGINRYLFTAKLHLTKGILDEYIVNDKLKVYSIIVTRIIKDTINELKDGAVHMDDATMENFKAFKTSYKEKVWEDVVKRATNGTNIAEGVSDISDEKLKAAFLK